MEKINLCIDIGNTRTKAAYFVGGIEKEYFANFTLQDFESLRKQFELEILISASGVNPDLEKEFEAKHHLSAKTNLPIVLDYKTPETLGSDRIASACGAIITCPQKTCVIVDLGTCLTLDLVHENTFKGGLISPGVDMRLKAMHQFTAKLPLVPRNEIIQFPGKSTAESMQVGAYQGVKNEIIGFIETVNQQYDDVAILDCGGVTLDFEKDLKNEIFARPKLVLEGLNYIIEHNAK